MVNKLQILVTEDDPQLRETLAQHLAEEGYEVYTAAHGNEAIPILHGREFHLVVLDLKMPYIDGFQVLQFIKATFPNTKVVVVTAYADLTNSTRARDLGADEIIGKPYNLAHLFEVIKTLLK